MCPVTKLQPWQQRLWDWLESIPPIPEGHVRKSYLDRKGRLRFHDIPEAETRMEVTFVALDEYEE